MNSVQLVVESDVGLHVRK